MKDLILLEKSMKVLTLAASVLINTSLAFASENINVCVTTNNLKENLLPVYSTSIGIHSKKCSHNNNYIRAYVQNDNGLFYEFIKCLDCGYDSKKDKK